MAKTKTLTEILKRLGVDIQATRPALKSKRPSMKPDTKVVKPKVAPTPKADTGPKLSVPSRTKGRKKVQATTPPIKAQRVDVKAKPKTSRTVGRKKIPVKPFTPIAGAGSRQPGRKIGEGVPTAGKGRATVKKTTPSIKAQRIDVKAKPKASRTIGRKKIPMKTFTPIAGAGSRKAGPTRNAFVSKPSAKTTPTRSKITPPVTPASKIKKGPLVATIGLGGAALTGAMLNKKDKAQASIPLPKSKPTPPSKPKATPEATPKVMPKSSGPSPRGSAKRGASKTISAGSNTGFGPKGNIFPGSSSERAALMKMYGGTGSAAAKAAAAGKQGNMEAGRKELMAAKKERLSKPAERKSGGKVGIKQIKTKGSVAMEQVPAKKSYNPSARQVKGFGAARRPKK